MTSNWSNTAPGFTKSYDLMRSTTSGSGYTVQTNYSPDTTITGTYVSDRSVTSGGSRMRRIVGPVP